MHRIETGRQARSWGFKLVQSWEFLLLKRSALGKARCAAIPLTLWQVAGLRVAATQGGWFLWLDGFACLRAVELGVTVSADDLACPNACTAALGTLGHRDKASEQAAEADCRNPTHQKWETAA